MRRYLTSKHIVGVLVFTITCVGSIGFFKEQVTGCLEPPSPPAPPLSVSAKFTRIGNTPTRSGPRSNLQFINEKQGWILQETNLWQTQDGGKSWELVYQMQENVSRFLNEFRFTNANDGWAKFSFYLYKTADGGRSWARVVTPMDDSNGSLWTFQLDSNGETGWIAGGMFQSMKLGDPCMNNATGSLPDGSYACLNGAVFRTNDGGASWQRQNIPQFVGRFMSIRFTDADHVWVAGDAGVFHTTNGGLTWNSDKFRRECEDYYELPDRYPASTFFVDNRNGWLVLSSGQIARSSDGGKTWCDLFEPETLWPYDRNYVGPWRQFHAIHFRDANYGIGLGNDKLVYETLDGGATWRPEGTDVTFELIEFLANANGWAISTDQELYRVWLQ